LDAASFAVRLLEDFLHVTVLLEPQLLDFWSYFLANARSTLVGETLCCGRAGTTTLARQLYSDHARVAALRGSCWVCTRCFLALSQCHVWWWWDGLLSAVFFLRLCLKNPYCWQRSAKASKWSCSALLGFWRLDRRRRTSQHCCTSSYHVNTCNWKNRLAPLVLDLRLTAFVRCETLVVA